MKAKIDIFRYFEDNGMFLLLISIIIFTLKIVINFDEKQMSVGFAQRSKVLIDNVQANYNTYSHIQALTCLENSKKHFYCVLAKNNRYFLVFYLMLKLKGGKNF